MLERCLESKWDPCMAKNLGHLHVNREGVTEGYIMLLTITLSRKICALWKMLKTGKSTE